jgi:hypothetical protein
MFGVIDWGTVTFDGVYTLFYNFKEATILFSTCFNQLGLLGQCCKCSTVPVPVKRRMTTVPTAGRRTSFKAVTGNTRNLRIAIVTPQAKTTTEIEDGSVCSTRAAGETARQAVDLTS